MKRFLAVLLILLAHHFCTAQSGEQPKAQCVSKTRGVTFPRFEEYQAVAKPIREHHRALLRTRFDRLFQTRIRKAAREKPNFAGHYVIADWGCGTGCAQFVIVDRENGKVFDTPFTSFASDYPENDEAPPWDCFDDFATYKLTSRLLIMEGCPGEGAECGRHFYVMSRSGLRKIKFDPDVPAK